MSARILAAGLAALALPAGAGDFPSIGTLGQDEFHRISQDLGAAFAYKGVTPATELGVLGFDLGVEVTQTSVEHSSLFQQAGAGSQSNLLVPKFHAHKGLGAGFDIGAFIAGAPDVSASLFGAELRYAILSDGLATPAVGVRLSGTKASGLGDLGVSTAALDLTVSKRFTLLTPYAGAGVVRIMTKADNSTLAKESFNEGRYFAGVNLNLLAVNLAFEAEKLGDNTSLSAKVGWRF